jgi:hypothetical protein
VIVRDVVFGDGDQVVVLFEGLPSNLEYDLTMELLSGTSVLGNTTITLMLPSGVHKLPVGLEPGQTTFNVGALELMADEIPAVPVVLGQSLVINTGVPVDSGVVAKVQAFIAPGGGGSSAIAAQTAIGNAVTMDRGFYQFTWQTATAVDWVNDHFEYEGLLPAGLVGGDLGGTEARTCMLHFRFWDEDNNYRGQTTEVAIRVYQPAFINLGLTFPGKR